jgi:hypothetical protein
MTGMNVPITHDYLGDWMRKHWRIVIFASVIAWLMIRVTWRIRTGINPDSLWLDDQWVATLALHASFVDLLELMPPAPLGFLLLLKLLTSVVGWGDWQLQLLPILFGLAQIPLIGWIAWRATDRVSLGVLAAILLSGSTMFLVFLLRVKQYTLEGLIALILIALALQCVRSRRAGAFATVVVAALVALPLSFTAIPVGLVLINVLSLHMLRVKDDVNAPSRVRVLASTALYNVAVLSWLGLVQMRQANETMYEFWWRQYLPIGDAEALREFTGVWLKQFLTGGLPPMLAWLVCIVPIGVVLLCLRRQTRLLGLAFILFYGGMLTLSAMQRYPIGGGRTDIFSYPITILSIVAGIWAVSRYARILPAIILAVVIARMLALFPHPTINYPLNDDRDTVETIQQMLAPEDGLIIGPYSSWAVACYGDWPIELVRTLESTNGFIALPDRADTVALPRRLRQGDDPAATGGDLIQPLLPLLQRRPHRIWVLSTYGSMWWVEAMLESRGYEAVQVPGTSTRILLFERGES